MPTTVYFASNRVLTGPADLPGSYSADIQPPSVSDGLTYGVAFVDGIDLNANVQGTISAIQTTQTGGFPDSAIGDLAAAGRNLLVFLHGFDNDFADAITRAAFNREWLAASGEAGADTTVVAFSWPSLGHVLGFPLLQRDYLRDRNMARLSGVHVMDFLANLQPILENARNSGYRGFLLAHSMGSLALQSAVENWFLHGNGPAALFDCAALAAGDSGYDSFAQPSPTGLSALTCLTRRASIYYSHADAVLQLSAVVNCGAQRLGQDGPRHRFDTAAFPPAQFTMVDASGFRDYDFNLLSSHQYYRRSPHCRSVIARDFST